MTDQKEHPITAQDRIVAQLALATEEAVETPCPDAKMLALLVDGRLPEPEQDALFQHLAHCPTCYDQWRIMAEVLEPPVKKSGRGKIISIVGGLLAAAASVMLFVNSGIIPTATMAPQEDAALFPLLESPPHEMLSVEEEVAGVGNVPEVAQGDELQSQKMEKMAKPSPQTQGRTDADAQRLQRQLEEQVLQEQKTKEAITQLKKSSQAAPRKKAASPRSSLNKLEFGDNNTFGSAPVASDDLLGLLDQDITEGDILLDINSVIPTVLQKMKQAEIGDVVEVKTYKRDRGFSVTRMADDQVLVQEYGYRDQQHTVAPAKLKRVLKNIIKIEFPRSNKVWLRSVTPASGNE